MAIASITAWLADPHRKYDHGRLLYEQYGSDRVLLALFKSGSTSFHASKLQSALQELNKSSNLEPKPIVIPDIPVVAPERPGDRPTGYENAPDKILEIRNQKNKHYAQARRLFESIRVMDIKQHRLEAGLMLLDLMDSVNDAWHAIDEWRETGRIREQQEKETIATVEKLSIPELIKESNNLPPNISKDRKKLAAATTAAEKIKISTRLELRIKRLAEVKRRLAGELV